ncbi:hypothetical protein DYB30_004167 [Aphanomyces astaci]|uniref:Cystathionine gamma-synthase n=2 Tax=Aphanomyces astaci TaxID=112090 RepID=A0A397EX75_APHAT|nr:hypothetical protein DYB30_004167 [Aphanomyces astaci]RHZ08249.1 hypothetical protein DYB31_007263 [Aphanomyces astaci]
MASLKAPRCLTDVPLGGTLPDDVHAVSVSMPEWDHVESYSQGCPKLHAALPSGYPRFVYHHYVVALNQWVRDTYVNDPTKLAYVLPSYDVATRCAAFMQVSYPEAMSLIDLGICGAFAIVVPAAGLKTFKSFWQHSGEITTSRMAKHILDFKDRKEAAPRKAMAGTPVHAALKERVASLYPRIGAADVLLYPCGMSAIFAAFRMAKALHATPRQGRKIVLFGFPYLDTLKIMRRPEWRGAADDFVFYPHGNSDEMDAIDQLESIGAIFTEFPTNPLLHSVDLKRLAAIARRHNAILIVDDTIGSYNVQVLDAGADVVATSLSKIFTCACTATGGSLVVNPASTWAAAVHTSLASDEYLFEDDCVELLAMSKDVRERLRRVNANASIIASRFASHPQVQAVYYPKFIDSDLYKANLTHPDDDSDAFGPLMSVVLRGGAAAAATFYDALNVAKGPSLGTNFTLSVPYTILAHYDELEYVASCGLDRNLVRFSIGLEDVDEIWGYMAVAFEAAATSCGGGSIPL